MQTATLVSVVIPSRDRPLLLREAIRSALAQTHSDLEIIVVDDGSRPPVELPRDLADDPRLTLIRIEDSISQAAARNLAVERSHGDFLAFLDDDDIWLPTKIERQLATLTSAGDGIGAVETGYDLMHDGEILFRYLPRTDRDLARAVLRESCLQPSTVLMRRQAFEELGGFDPTIDRTDDWELWMRFADSYEVVSIPEVLVIRTHNPLPANMIWHARRSMLKRLAPRIRRLRPADRVGLLLYHWAVLLAARVRMILGDAIWFKAKALLRAIYRKTRPGRDTDPPLRRW